MHSGTGRAGAGRFGALASQGKRLVDTLLSSGPGQRKRSSVDRDKKKLEMMQQRIREDEQTLSELKRVEGERGGESDAVRLVFPTPDGPRM